MDLSPLPLGMEGCSLGLGLGEAEPPKGRNEPQLKALEGVIVEGGICGVIRAPIRRVVPGPQTQPRPIMQLLVSPGPG